MSLNNAMCTLTLWVEDALGHTPNNLTSQYVTKEIFLHLEYLPQSKDQEYWIEQLMFCVF